MAIGVVLLEDMVLKDESGIQDMSVYDKLFRCYFRHRLQLRNQLKYVQNLGNPRVAIAQGWMDSKVFVNFFCYAYNVPAVRVYQDSVGLGPQVYL